jgi:putative protein-disulfide isomerase
MSRGWSLVYVADPMCSWCYGFAPQLERVREAHPHLPLQLVMGGLRQDEAPMDERLRAHLRRHWGEVASRSGQPFDLAWLQREDFVYTTEPACRAVITVRERAPQLCLAMFSAIQRGFYAEGRDVTRTEELCALAESIGLPRSDFEPAFHSPELREATLDDVAMVHRWGIGGFPTLIAAREGEGQVVAPGYVEAPFVIEQLRRLGVS